MEDDYRRIYVGNLPEKIDEELLYELFIQAGPVEEISLPKKPNGTPKPFAFIHFKHESSVLYAKELLETTRIFGNELKIQPKMKDAASRVREQVEKLPDVNGLNVLRGFGDNRYHSVDSSINARQANDNQMPGVAMPDFNHLLHLSQQLQQSIPSFRSIINQPIYQSQQPDFPMPPEIYYRGSDLQPHHSRNNRSNRHLMPHPYRDDRPQRLDRQNQHSGSRHHQFPPSGNHQRERKGRRH